MSNQSKDDAGKRHHQVSTTVETEKTLDALGKFVEVQTKEIALKEREVEFKRQELEVRKQEIDSNREIALQSILAQKDDRKEQAIFFSGVDQRKFYFKFLVVVALLATAAMFIFTDNAQYVIELAKIGGGVFAGYIAGLYKGKSDQQDRNNSNQSDDD
ncbi:MAG: hypothetical protein LBN41_04380 [Enterobacteriaceae bacterium]|nr:hypothetical protein [Enterobacteriaceae bacterium]